MALSFDAWKPGEVRPATVEVPVHVIEAAESPQLRATLKGHEEIVWQVAWAPDGRTLASLAVTGGEVRLWDVAGRKERTLLRSDLGNSYALAFAPDGKTLLVGRHQNDAKAGPTGGVEVWDVATGQRKGLLRQAPLRGVARLALSPDGKLLAATESWREGEKSEYKSCLTLWDVAAGKPVARLADDSPSALAFSPDGQSLAWTAYVFKERQIDSALVRRRDLAKQQDLPPLQNTAAKSPLGCLAFSPGGRTLAGADYAGNILLWDTASGKVRSTLRPEGGRRVSSLAFAPDGKTLAAALGDRPGRDHEPGLIVLWDTATGKQRLTLTGHTNAALSVAFSPDGKLLASGSSDRTVRLWDMTAPAAGEAGGGR